MGQAASLYDVEQGRTDTLVAVVMANVRQRIASRSLTPGARLPSIRAMAEAQSVSKSTVVEAYERLAAEGTIRSRPGSGFFVAAPLAPLSLAAIGPKRDHAVDPLWISRQSLDANPTTLKPGCGWMPGHWMPEAAIRKGLRSLARAETVALTDYATPLGLPALRQLLARRMADAGITASPDQLIMTDSGTAAIDLLCRFLLEPGDTVLVDDPCYFNFHALLRAHRVKVVGVPYTPNGPDVERFAEAMRAHAPRLYITNSGLHNPTGATLSPMTAHRLLKLADEGDLTIIEDDIFADFEPNPAARLAAFDGLERVIHIGSFSKTLSAAFRCGYIAAPARWVEPIADLRIATSFGGERMAAELVLGLLRDGGYRRHLDAVRPRLAKAMSTVSRRLNSLGLVPWIMPRAGMFLWCRLPDGLDAADVARACLAENIVLAPGNAFSPGHGSSSFLRFNVTQTDDERIYSALERAMRISRE